MNLSLSDKSVLINLSVVAGGSPIATLKFSLCETPLLATVSGLTDVFRKPDGSAPPERYSSNEASLKANLQCLEQRGALITGHQRTLFLAMLFIKNSLQLLFRSLRIRLVV